MDACLSIRAGSPPAVPAGTRCWLADDWDTSRAPAHGSCACANGRPRARLPERPLTPSSYVVLGMLGLGARTGYDVRRAVELSARFFWTISPVQIYPELKRLETAGMVEGHDDPRGGRPRRAYQLTDRGHAALEDWLAADEELTYELRDLGMLKLFFADAAPDDARVAGHLEAMAERS